MLLGKEGGDFVNFINSLFLNEKHLLDMNFMDLEQIYRIRLNEDLTPKDWSQFLLIKLMKQLINMI